MAVRSVRRFLMEAAVTALVVVALGTLMLYVIDPGRFEPHPAVTLKESRAPLATTVAARGGTATYADAVAAAAPAVVNVFTAKVIANKRANPFMDDPFFRRFFGDKDQLPSGKRLENSLGSGVIMSPDGYILTNYHVIEGADEIRVALNDGRSIEAKVVGSDPETDLAVLKIAYDHLPSVVIGPSDALRVGDVVLAIGNPFGVGQTVTQGIVSATGRTQLGISTFENFIQTDAAINPGNSGGALIDPNGRLIGINTAIFTRSGGSQGIGFAIPTALATGVMKQIIEHGAVVRGWLGIEAQDLSPELAESFNLRDVKGIIVAGVMPNGPGDKAGIQTGDVITQVGQQAVNDARDIMIKIAAMPPGSRVAVDLMRNGHPLHVQAEVGRRPPKPAEAG